MHSLTNPITVILTATEAEQRPLRAALGKRPALRWVVSGMGASNAVLATAQAIRDHRPALLVQAGIAGAFDRSLAIAEVVAVASDFQADLGAWRGDRFEPFDTPLLEAAWLPPRLRTVTAQTANVACLPAFPRTAQIETMEGAPFFAACQAAGQACWQIRAISNYVDDPRPEWHVGPALDALAQALADLLADNLPK